MKRQLRLFGLLACITLFLLLSLLSVLPTHANQTGRPHLQATEGSDLPPDIPIITFDNPTMVDFSLENPTQLFIFQGKAGQIISVTLTPKSNDLFIGATILDSDLQNILGELKGTAVVGGTVTVKLPQDGQYVISLGYSEQSDAEPKAGNVGMLLLEYKTK
jgi:hypothetical protein